MLPVIVTRTQPGAAETGARVEALGATPLIAPALEIRFFPLQEDWAPQPDESLIFTSANGVHAYEAAGWSNDHRVVAVGPATTNAAKVAGFSDILNADGNSDDVVELISSSFRASDTRWVHYSNDAAAGQIVERLSVYGFNIRFVPLYGTIAVPWEAVQPVLSESRAGILLIHSTKAAEAVQGWIGNGRIGPSGFHLVAVSERASAPLAGLGWRSVVNAVRPNENKLMEALQIAMKPGVSSR